MMTMIGMMMTTKIWTMMTTKIMTLTPTMVTAAGVFSGVVLTPRRCHMAAQHFIQRAECGGGGLYRFIKTTPTLNLWQTSTYYVIYHVLYNCNNGLFDVNCVSQFIEVSTTAINYKLQQLVLLYKSFIITLSPQKQTLVIVLVVPVSPKASLPRSNKYYPNSLYSQVLKYGCAKSSALIQLIW